MNPIIVGISLVATLLSTVTYLTVPGEYIKNGPGLMWSYISVIPVYFIVGHVVIPRIMKKEIVSAYELLTERFGQPVRKTAAVLFMFVRLFWIAFILYTCSMAVSTITDVNIYLILIAIGIITTIYTAMGGVRAVVLTDVIQFVIL